MVNLLLYALAQRENPKFHWLEVRTSEEPLPEVDPARLGWISPDRLWSVDASEGLSPDHARTNAAVFELIRDDEPPAVISRLVEFIGLPPTIQRILGILQPPRGPNLLAIANIDRIAARFAREVVPSLLTAFMTYGCSLFVGSLRLIPRDVPGFASVIVVEGESLRAWREASVTLKRGAPLAGLSLDTPVRLQALPLAQRVFSAAQGVSSTE